MADRAGEHGKAGDRLPPFQRELLQGQAAQLHHRAATAGRADHRTIW